MSVKLVKLFTMRLWHPIVNSA